MKPVPQVKKKTSLRTWWAAMGAALVLTAIMGAALWDLRHDALGAQAGELNLLSLALTDEIDRGLRGTEAGLRTIRAELGDSRLPMTGAEAGRALLIRARLMPVLQTLWLVDSNGGVLSSSGAIAPPLPASFFPRLDHVAEGAVTISSPFVRPGSPDLLFAVAMRFDHGWIVAAMPAKSLLGAFSVATPASDARMAVFRADGVRLAGAIAQPRQPGDDAAVPAATDEDRLVSLQKVSRYGLKVVLTREVKAALVDWHNTVKFSIAGLVLLLTMLLVSVLLVRRADWRHAEAQRALETQQVRSGKLEALGTLAGSGAHDFNNLLASIIGFTEMAQDEAPVGNAQFRHLERVLKAAHRGKALLQRILVFAQGGAQTSAVFELEPVVDEVLDLITTSLWPGVTLERRLEAPGALLRGDSTLAFEAVLNLCTNAQQAMPGDGRLSVQLRRTPVASPQVLSHSQLCAGDYLALTVSDQGTGITPDVMDRLFEPFFSTRERSAQAGTGLGLSVVHGVVNEFGGAIDVQSVPGQGAKFTLYFPEHSENAATASGIGFRTAPIPMKPFSAQSIMVVDDDPELLTLTSEVVEALGYTALAFGDSTAALQVLRHGSHRFAALISDERMPALSGTKLVEALRAFAPDLPVLLISGFGGAALAERAAAAGATRVLAKPLARTELARVLKELLGSSHDAS